MTLYELFAPHTNQEFPPKFVFCIVNGIHRSIKAKEIQLYETLYEYVAPLGQTSEYWSGPVGEWSLPTLKRK
jgi:hypothetical protein